MSCSSSRFYAGNLAWNKAKFSADTLRTWQEVATDPDTLSENAVDTWVGWSVCNVGCRMVLEFG